MQKSNTGQRAAMESLVLLAFPSLKKLPKRFGFSLFYGKINTPQKAIKDH